MITVTNIRKSFGNLQVLKNLNFEISKGGIVAILGPNGSGKTTFLKILLGMVIPDGGHILSAKRYSWVSCIQKAHWLSAADCSFPG